MTRNLRLLVEYDGTDFAGWQRQERDRTVQGVLEEAIGALVRERVCLHGSGRTDAGVHARGQVASFVTSSRLACDAIMRAVNATTSRDVSVLEACEVPADFHARKSATAKEYSYTILVRPVPSPLARRTAHWVRRPLDVAAMAEAASQLVGLHDFSAFAAAGSPRETTVRNLQALDVVVEAPLVRLVARADGFLYRMVRNLAGTLIEVGHERMTQRDVEEILASRDRSRAGPTAPPHGLCLERVCY